MWQGFKDFIMRGNVVDLAVGVVIGSAFGGVVKSLVEDIITPLISILAKLPDFSKMTLVVNNTSLKYGNFLNALIGFLLVALAIYFFVIVPMQKVINKFKPAAAPTTKECEECKSTVHIEAKRCAFCQQPLKK
jgi:large conductance mechanosensitive channel